MLPPGGRVFLPVGGKSKKDELRWKNGKSQEYLDFILHIMIEGVSLKKTLLAYSSSLALAAQN